MAVEEFLSNYFDITTNETIHKHDIEKSFQHAVITNYQKLLTEQTAMCDVKKYEFPLFDMKQVIRLPGQPVKITDRTKYSYQINEGIVCYDKRHLLPSLGLMGELLTQDEISANQHGLFNKNYIAFIGNYMVDCFSVVISDDYTTIVLNTSSTEVENAMSVAKYQELLEANAIVTLYTVPNFYKENLRINNATLVTKLAGSISFDRLSNPSTFDKNTLFFINKSSEYSLKSLIECEVTEDSVDVLDTSDLDSVRYVLSIIKIPNLRLYNTFTEDSWFQLNDFKSPVPSVNMFPMVLNTTENATTMQEIKIDSYYPNIYNITGIHSGDKVILGFFYSDTSWLTYDNRLELFYRYVPEPLSLYESGEIWDVIKDYKPVDIPYYSELYTDKVHMPYTFPFKVNRFREFMGQDYKYLIHYLYTKLKGKMRHYIYMNKLDLPSRIRTDNSKECFPTPNVPLNVYRENYTEVTFPEERYLFSLPKVVFGPNEEFRFFLDNLAVMPSIYHLQADAEWYHLYIPCSMIKEDSVLEIEKFPKYQDEITMPAEESASGKFIFTKPKEVSHVYVNNLHMYNANTMEFIPSEAYTITIKDHFTGDLITVNNKSRASIIDTAEINIINEKYVGVPMVIGVKTHPRFYYNPDATEIMQIRAYNDVELTNDFIRPYVDGIFLTPFLFLGLYDTDTSGLYNGIINLVINTELTDRIFMVDVMPSAMRLEYSKRGIFCDEKGFVNTGNFLSLPIDLKWYDVYVNGRKLNKTNIEIISPNKFFVKGIDSRKNIEIWLRGDAPTEFKFYQYDNTIDDMIWSTEEIREIIRENQDILDDSLNDIYDEVIVNVLAELDDFIDKYLRYSFINPNEQQLNATIEQRYPDLFNEYNIMWLDSNTWPEADYLTFINSNVRDDEMKNGQYRFGFTPMYIGSHEDALPGEYMCDPITGLPGVKDVNDQTILPGGNIQRLVCHRNNFANVLMRNGFTDMTIYQLEFEENTTAKLVVRDQNILDVDNFEVLSAANGDITPSDIGFSIDADVLEEGFNNVMKLSKYTPIVTVHYKYVETATGNEITGTMSAKLSALQESMLAIVTSNKDENGTIIEDIYTGFTIEKITIGAQAGDEEIFDSKKIILHSILIAF